VPVSGGGPGHRGVFEDFARAVREGRPPLVTGEEGRKSLELVNAVLLSSYLGRWVELPVDRDAYDEMLRELRAGRRRGAG